MVLYQCIMGFLYICSNCLNKGQQGAVPQTAPAAAVVASDVDLDALINALHAAQLVLVKGSYLFFVVTSLIIISSSTWYY